MCDVDWTCASKRGWTVPGIDAIVINDDSGLVLFKSTTKFTVSTAKVRNWVNTIKSLKYPPFRYPTPRKYAPYKPSGGSLKEDIERLDSRVQQPCKFIGTKESFYSIKEFNSHRIGFLNRNRVAVSIFWNRHENGCHDVK